MRDEECLTLPPVGASPQAPRPGALHIPGDDAINPSGQKSTPGMRQKGGTAASAATLKHATGLTPKLTLKTFFQKRFKKTF